MTSQLRLTFPKRVRATLVACAIAAAAVAVTVPASAYTPTCTASGAVAVGWGGSRWVPVAPQGVGPSCSLDYFGGSGVELWMTATGPIGAQVIHRTSGLRYFCRGVLEPQLGQNRNAYPVFCQEHVQGGMTMFVPAGLLPGPSVIYCSTTGELGVLVDIMCRAT